MLVLDLVREYDSDNKFLKNFPTARHFADFVQIVRREFSSSQGWMTAKIQTAYGLNSTGVFRSILNIIRGEVLRGGGVESIIPYSEKRVSNERVFYHPTNANSMKQCEEAKNCVSPFVLFDIFADGTTLSK